MREVTEAASSTAKRLGCLTKYTPWAIAFFHIVWLMSVGACLIFIAIGGCDDRFNSEGLQAILNCRLYFSMCCDGSDCGQGLLPKDVYQCNYEIFLAAYGFLTNPIQLPVVGEICNHILNLVQPATTGCPPGGDIMDCYGDTKDTSDFEKVFILYTIWSGLAWVSTTAFFVIVKIATPLESFFFQVSNPNEFFLLHYSRKWFTPWG
eukprot:Blabericola_migrator_1__1501@NODE_1397_length_4628_cov_1018_531462_g923_i1_p3_GENE_NODE_1397_length_4628_cov_1018_531462_g923_i1NODE_1397_length_4628_cov_1018_531462_g923_i1_p3_ORF_typecomplete_len206_score28_37_NODE_1397_length_4628_cov_1018_531462_g923_i15521169